MKNLDLFIEKRQLNRYSIYREFINRAEDKKHK